jgi:hypothetical protein
VVEQQLLEEMEQHLQHLAELAAAAFKLLLQDHQHLPVWEH